MMNIVTIDAGTTNTRTSLWRHGQRIAQCQVEIGVRDTAIHGHNGALKQAIRDTLLGVLVKASLAMDEVALVLASGMLTSAMGLVDLAHLQAPAGLAELAAGMQRIDMPDVCPLPLWLIPGVRNAVAEVDMHNHEVMDMMRGEETEVMGLIKRLDLAGPAMLIMPGSHTKLVSVDERGAISGCATTLAGELLQVITQSTLISQSLGGDFAHHFSADMVRAGAAAAQKTGLARACFNVRTLAQFTDVQRDERANFLLGAVLSGDVLALKNSSAIQMRPHTPIVITGKPMLREALALLIQENGFFYGKRIVVNDQQQADLAGFGALIIAQARGLIPATVAAAALQP